MSAEGDKSDEAARAAGVFQNLGFDVNDCEKMGSYIQGKLFCWMTYFNKIEFFQNSISVV
jgi:hypothetical protein